LPATARESQDLSLLIDGTRPGNPVRWAYLDASTARGTVIELLEFSHRKLQPGGGQAQLGYTNISLSVADLDDAYARVERSPFKPEQTPVEIGGVRMFFVRDPDGTPIEFVEFPNRERTSAEMWRGTAP